MPSLPPALSEWLQPGLLTGVLGLPWYEIKASAARTGKRIDELRDELKASETRQREDTQSLLEDIKALGDRLDRLIEAS